MKKGKPFEIIKDAGLFDGDLFRPAKYRLALFVLNPPQDDIEEFYRTCLQHNLKQVESIVSLIPSFQLQQMFGGEGTVLKKGIERAIQLGNTLTTGLGIDPALEATRQFLTDFITLEADEVSDELSGIRHAALQRTESLPERLGKHRQLAEEALLLSLIDQTDEPEVRLNDAVHRMAEVIEQPVGSRDPICWLLYGWALSLRDGFTRDTLDALSSACLTASATQDYVFAEAHRMLAYAQSHLGNHGEAYNTIQKALVAPNRPDVHLECVRAAFACGKDQEAKDHFKKVLLANPIYLLSIFTIPSLLATGPMWCRLAEEVTQQRSLEAQAEVAQLERTIALINDIAKDAEFDLSVSPAIHGTVSDLKSKLDSAHLFELSWVTAEARRLIEVTTRNARELANSEFQNVREKVHLATHELENLRDWKRECREQAYVLLGHKKHQEKIALGLHTDSSDRVQAGCMFSLFSGCALYTGYFLLASLSVSFAAFAGPSTRQGKMTLLLLMTPIILGILMTMVESSKRMVAQSEYQKRCVVLEKESEISLEEVEQDFQANAKDVQLAIDQAKEEQSAVEEVQGRIAQIGHYSNRAA